MDASASMGSRRPALELQVSRAERADAFVDLLWREPCRRTRRRAGGHEDRALLPSFDRWVLWCGHAGVSTSRAAAGRNGGGYGDAAAAHPFARADGAPVARNAGAGAEHDGLSGVHRDLDVVQPVRDAAWRVRRRRRPSVTAVRPPLAATTHRAVRPRRGSDVRTSMGLTSLHITNAYHPSSGGIRTFYNALLEAADRERRRVRLLVPGPETRVEEVGQFGRIYFVRAPLAPVFDRRYRLILPWRFMPGLRGHVIRILEHERPDLVEICDKYSLPYLAAMLRKRWHPRVPRPLLAGLTCERFDDNMAAFCSASRPARAFTRWYIRHIYGPPFDVHIANSD